MVRIAASYRTRLCCPLAARRAVSRSTNEVRLPSGLSASVSSSPATAQAMAISPSHVQVPSSIFVSGSISPPLFATATIAAMRRRTRADEGSRIACDRNAREGVLALAGLRRPRRYSIKPCRMARPNRGTLDRLRSITASSDARAMDLPMPARKASGERHAPLRINRPTTTS